MARLAAHQAFSAASLMSPAAMRWMAALCMRRASAKMGVGSAEVVVMGFSLGGMIARVGGGGLCYEFGPCGPFLAAVDGGLGTPLGG